MYTLIATRTKFSYRCECVALAFLSGWSPLDNLKLVFGNVDNEVVNKVGASIFQDSLIDPDSILINDERCLLKAYF